MPRSPKQKSCLLICAKTAASQAAITAALNHQHRFSVQNTVNSLSAAQRLINEEHFDSILLDSELLSTDWESAYKTILAYSADVAVIIIFNPIDEAESLQALKYGAQDCLPQQDLGDGRLERAVNAALIRYRHPPPFVGDKSKFAVFENQLSQLLDRCSDPTLILGENHEIRFLNPVALALLETEASRVIGEIFPFTIDKETVTELEIPTSENKFHTFELTALDIYWQGKPSLLVIMQPTVQPVVESAASNSEARKPPLSEQTGLQAWIENLADAVMLTDGGGRITKINPTAAELWAGRAEDCLGKIVGDFIQPSQAQHSGHGSQRLPSDDILPSVGTPSVRWDALLKQADGAELAVTATLCGLFDAADSRCGCIVTLQPLDAWKAAVTDPFSSVSLRVGGIAHDFNNMLTAILGNLALARLTVEDAKLISQRLEAAEIAALQAKSLSQQLLNFSKDGTLVLAHTSVPEIISECAQFSLCGTNVDFKLNGESEVWQVDADKGRISQVINNLLINADEAMPEGGTIEICLRNLKIRRSEVPGLMPGEYVCIEVKDAGIGISAENLEQVFTPYFTTKESGNGLGLPFSYSVVRSYQGTITADSSLGCGSIFRVYLPKSDSEKINPEHPETKATAEQALPVQPGHGRILLMDDMDAMLLVASEILNILGYDVECCTDGQEAIEAYKKAKKSGRPFDAVVFDLTVPGGMGGEEAANVLKKYDPELVAIASSGYSNSDIMSDHETSAFQAVVPKPYRIDEMSDTLHAVLAGK